MPDRDTITARRTQAERRDESERRLLRAAVELIADHGVSAATFEAVGQRAGYSRGLATQKFGSKQGMIEALIARLHEQQDEALAQAGIDRAPGFEALLGYVDHYLRQLGKDAESRAYFMLLADAAFSTTSGTSAAVML